MKNTTIIFLLFLASANTVMAQGAAKAVYFELGGPGLASVNYDMRLNNKQDGIGFRAGIGGFSVEGTSALFIPLAINYLIGKDKKNYFEFGGGVTLVSINDNYISDTNDNNFNTTFGHLYFGYRLQPKDGGFLFRAGMTPIFNSHGFVPYYAGISFGYKF
jgi:hypothetical protein